MSEALGEIGKSDLKPIDQLMGGRKPQNGKSEKPKKVPEKQFHRKTFFMDKKWIDRIDNEAHQERLPIQDMMDKIFSEYFKTRKPAPKRPGRLKTT